MPTFEATTTLPCSPEDAYDWHAREGAFQRLVPPWDRVQVIRKSGGIEPGARLVMRVHKGPMWVTWEALHHAAPSGLGFVDEQVRGPFSRWVHSHTFEPTSSGSVLRDRVEYRLPMGHVSEWLAGRPARETLARMFGYRHRRTLSDMKRHQAFSVGNPLVVAISGASGLVGSELSAFLTTGGHTVRPLVRGQPKRGSEISWNPGAGHIDTDALEGVDAVVHLAGENVAGGRWTPERKRAILESRTKGTRLVSEALAKLKRPPKVLICASAIGIYGDAGESAVDESSPAGQGFLAEVCSAWEAASAPAASAGIRVVTLRIGVVISAKGGALGKMLLPFRLGLGGRVGSGQQWLSWVHINDLVGMIHQAMLDPSWEGVYNATAPEPVRQVEFARTLATSLRRPAVAPLPALAVRTLFGEMGEQVLLAGARVMPTRAMHAGFTFHYPELRGALAHELGS